MAGLAGWVAAPDRGPGKKAGPGEDALGEMLGALSHRTAEGEALVGLIDRGPKRTAVMGATLCDTASRISVALDGAIANAAALRAELSAKGYQFAVNSGAELLLRAYQRWDKDVAKHLRGAFAFAIWDSRKDRLLLARDRFGEKPLYVHESDGALYFASEPKALLALPGFKAEVDLEAMWETLAYRYAPGPATLFRGVRKLPPATSAFWQFARMHETRYWTPPDRNPSKEGARASEPVEGFVSQLDEAIRLRGGAGVFLSGGFDSAAIVALASNHGGSLKTFSLAFEGDTTSELPRAAAMAKHFGAAHHEIVVAPREVMADLAALVASRDAPSCRPYDLAYWRLSGEAARTVRVVLTGDGGDEILGGYRRYLAGPFAARFGSPPAVLAPLAQPLLSTLRNGQSKAASADRPPFDADPRSSRLRRALYFDQVSSLPDHLLERNDRAAAAFGIEARMPYLDDRLAEYVSGLPDEQRVRGLETKRILRHAVRGLIPKELAVRKGGFRIPMRDWLRKELREPLLEHLQGSASLTRKYYDTALLDRLIDQHLRGRHNHEVPLWTLLNLEVWHRRYRPV
jgi:asparagine synthase (glutamine-hydrolysing)